MIRLTSSFGVLAIAVALTACGGPSGDAPEGGEIPAIGEDTLSAIEGDTGAEGELISFAIPVDELISGVGIGAARVGMTLGELRDVLGDQDVRFEAQFMVDMSAVCVHDEAGQELYCATVWETDEPSADDEIVMVTTRHPRLRTEEGVGPGVTIADAEEIYGAAILLYNTSNESREYLEFDSGPAGSIAFRPFSPGAPDEFAGVYDTSEGGEYFETETYRPDAIIEDIEVHGSRGE